MRGRRRRILPNYSWSSRKIRPVTWPGIVAANISKSKDDRRHRWHQPVRPVAELHPGLRARRQVGQVGHQGRPRYVSNDFVCRVQRPRRRARSSPTSSSPEPTSTSCSRSPARPATASSSRLARRHLRDRRRRRPVAVHPERRQCIVTSAEKHLQNSATGRTIQQHFGAARRSATSSCSTPKNDGIGVSPTTTSRAMITADIQTVVDDAIAGMAAGTSRPAPTTCGTRSDAAVSEPNRRPL